MVMPTTSPSSFTTAEPAMADNEFATVTPGEMLREEFLKEYGLSQNRLARAVGISPNRIAEIVNNRRRISADTALRLSLYSGNSPKNPLRPQDRAPAPEFRGGRAHQGTPRRVELAFFRPPPAPPREGCRGGRGRGRRRDG